MQILGIDPGYATTGFGVVQSLPGTLKLLNYGTITTPAAMKFPQRLEMLYDDMVRLLDTVRPDAVAVEELFWGHNVTTGIGVSHGRGVILLAVAKSGVPLFEYTPGQVKQAVGGYGSAEKKSENLVILKGEADISTMPIEYAPAAPKYNAAMCKMMNITPLEGYTAIEG